MIESIIILAGLGLLSAFALGIASRAFHVDTDPRIQLITDLLPGANCGGCGFAGCSALASAIVSGNGKIEACSAISDDNRKEAASVMGVEVTETVKRVAVIHCNYPAGGVGNRFEYIGVADCRAANLVSGGPKGCLYACIGLGTCKSVCPFDAVSMSDSGLPSISPEKCVACGKCVEACPKNIIDIAPASRTVQVLCSSHDRGAQVKKLCSVGCINCMLCQRICPFEAIHVIDNIARIDYEKCRVCGLCVRECPTGSIANLRGWDQIAEIGEACNGCTLCARVCPVNAISGSPKERHVVDPERCIGCGICVEQCKRDAITLVRKTAAVKKAAGAAGAAGV
jgi:Na+-translocating ferredoxin:NAD+ oxidoreductase RNF subunit RnfB